MRGSHEVFGAQYGEFRSLVRLFCPKAATDGLTIVARSADTGEMMGALLTEDSTSPMPEGIDQLSPKFDPIFDILGQLDTRPSGGNKRPPGRAAVFVSAGDR